MPSSARIRAAVLPATKAPNVSTRSSASGRSVGAVRAVRQGRASRQSGQLVGRVAELVDEHGVGVRAGDRRPRGRRRRSPRSTWIGEPGTSQRPEVGWRQRAERAALVAALVGDELLGRVQRRARHAVAPARRRSARPGSGRRAAAPIVSVSTSWSWRRTVRSSHISSVSSAGEPIVLTNASQWPGVLTAMSTIPSAHRPGPARRHAEVRPAAHHEAGDVEAVEDVVLAGHHLVGGDVEHLPADVRALAEGGGDADGGPDPGARPTAGARASTAADRPRVRWRTSARSSRGRSAASPSSSRNGPVAPNGGQQARHRRSAAHQLNPSGVVDEAGHRRRCRSVRRSTTSAVAASSASSGSGPLVGDVERHAATAGRVPRVEPLGPGAAAACSSGRDARSARRRRRSRRAPARSRRSPGAARSRTLTPLNGNVIGASLAGSGTRLHLVDGADPGHG